LEVCGWRLQLEDEGFDFSVLCEFRARPTRGHAEYLLFEAMLTYLAIFSTPEMNWLRHVSAVETALAGLGIAI